MNRPNSLIGLGISITTIATLQFFLGILSFLSVLSLFLTTKNYVMLIWLFLLRFIPLLSVFAGILLIVGKRWSKYLLYFLLILKIYNVVRGFTTGFSIAAFPLLFFYTLLPEIIMISLFVAVLCLPASRAYLYQREKLPN